MHGLYSPHSNQPNSLRELDPLSRITVASQELPKPTLDEKVEGTPLLGDVFCSSLLTGCSPALCAEGVAQLIKQDV